MDVAWVGRGWCLVLFGWRVVVFGAARVGRGWRLVLLGWGVGRWSACPLCDLQNEMRHPERVWVISFCFPVGDGRAEPLRFQTGPSRVAQYLAGSGRAGADSQHDKRNKCPPQVRVAHQLLPEIPVQFALIVVWDECGGFQGEGCEPRDEQGNPHPARTGEGTVRAGIADMGLPSGIRARDLRRRS